MKKSVIFKIFLLSILFFLFIYITATSYVSTTFNNIFNNTFRLHIVANSNSVEDQNLKLKVRDAVLEYLKSQNFPYYNKKVINNFLETHTNDIYNVCLKTLNLYNCTMPIELFIGESYFPTKNYNNISFPSGTYSCLKIKIGNSIGENWWCSLFPPLCFSNVASGTIEEKDSIILKENLPSEEYLLLSSDDDSIKLKFKIIEIINSLKHSLS